MILRARLPSLLALALPVLAGMVWMAATGAPQHYPLVNGAALAPAMAWIALGQGPESTRGQIALAGALLLLMFAPLLSGPAVPSASHVEVTRWLPLGPVSLHAGMLALPTLAVLAARNASTAAPILSVALLTAMLQPDAGSGFAITFAAVGLHHATKDWKVGLVAILAFFASLRMVVLGELAPQTFVERVLFDAAGIHWLASLALALTLLFAFLLLTFAIPANRTERLTLGGTLFGLVVIALMAPYPTPLIGYGAAPILGFGIALGLHRKSVQ